MTGQIGQRGWLCALFAAITIGALAGLTGAEVPVIEARVKVPPAKEASVYLRFQNNRLWMATSRERLQKATPTRAAHVGQERDAETGIETRSFDFPEVDLPLSLNGIEKAHASFHYSRDIGRSRGAPSDQTRAVGVFSLSRHDAAGAAWTYTMHSIVERATNKAAAQPLEMVLPQVDPDGLKLAIETKVEGRNARIGLRVWSGEVNLASVKKGEANAPATIEIVDLNGKSVVSEKGDLGKFGFT